MENTGKVHLVVTTGCEISTEILAFRACSEYSDRILFTTNCAGIDAVAEKNVALP